MGIVIWPDWPWSSPPLTPPAPPPASAPAERPDEAPVSHPDPSVPQKHPSAAMDAEASWRVHSTSSKKNASAYAPCTRS